MDSFILIPPGPEVSGQEAGIHPGQANKHHHGYAGRYHHFVKGCPGAEGLYLALSRRTAQHRSGLIQGSVTR